MRTAPSGQVVVRLFAGNTLSGPSLLLLPPGLVTLYRRTINLDGWYANLSDLTSETFIVIALLYYENHIMSACWMFVTLNNRQ